MEVFRKNYQGNYKKKSLIRPIIIFFGFLIFAFFIIEKENINKINL